MFQRVTAWASLIVAMAFTLGITLFAAPESRRAVTINAKLNGKSARSGHGAVTLADRIPVAP